MTLAIAAQQSCRPIELRAALSRARLLREDTRQSEVSDLLAPVYGVFTEGFDRPALQASKTLLAQLS